jgi:hypothetical protein
MEYWSIEPDDRITGCCHPEPPKPPTTQRDAAQDGEGSQNAQLSAETQWESTQLAHLEILHRPAPLPRFALHGSGGSG